MTLSAYVNWSSNTQNAAVSYKKRFSNHGHSQTNQMKESLSKGAKPFFKTPRLVRARGGGGETLRD
jgi:hypothetical protein